MRRGSILLVAAALALVGLLSNVIASDLWERIKSSPWYSLPAAVVALAILTALATWFQHRREQSSADTPAVTITPQLRAALLDKIEQQRVKGRLEQGLRKALRVDLKLTETAAAVERQLRVYTLGESEPPEERPTDGDIAAIFRAAQGSLLILGEPGTGKTNLLLELTAALIEEARGNPAAKIPVVFSLSRWTLERRNRTLAEWLAADLNLYGVSRETAGALVRQDAILPLLDGLDEVAADRRAACVEAIHAYQRERDLAPMVVCCRITESRALPGLKLRTAVRVEKLTREEVDRYLGMERLRHVGRALRADPELLEIIDTPLWLHVALMTADVQAAPNLDGLSPRDRLFARFIRYALHRKPEMPAKQQTPEPDFLRWISWLARRMKERNQTQFAMEGLRYTWLFRERTARRASSATTGLGCVLVVALVSRLGGATVGAMVFSQYSGQLAASETLFDDPIEDLHFVWAGWRSLGAGLVVGLVFGLGVGLGVGRVHGLVFGLVYGLYSILEVSLRSKPLTTRSLPNQGTQRSLRYFGLILLVGTMVQSLLVLVPRGDTRVLLSAAFGMLAVLLCLSKGGMFAAHHYALRLLLWHRSAAPLRYVRFLNEAVDRLFLIRNGGTYEFFHVSFRDYLTNLPDRR